MLASLRFEDFTPLVGQTVTIVGDHGATLELAVARVLDRQHLQPPSRRGDVRAPFTVLLSGPLSTVLLDGLFTLNLGSGTVVETVGIQRVLAPDGEGDTAWYQIVFN